MKMIERSKKALAADFPQAKVIFYTPRRRAYVLNESAGAIWDFCARPRDVDSVAAHLRQRYGISALRAKRDIKRFLRMARKNRIMSFQIRGKKGK